MRCSWLHDRVRQSGRARGVATSRYVVRELATRRWFKNWVPRIDAVFKNAAGPRRSSRCVTIGAVSRLPNRSRPPPARSTTNAGGTTRARAGVPAGAARRVVRARATALERDEHRESPQSPVPRRRSTRRDTPTRRGSRSSDYVPQRLDSIVKSMPAARRTAWQYRSRDPRVTDSCDRLYDRTTGH